MTEFQESNEPFEDEPEEEEDDTVVIVMSKNQALALAAFVFWLFHRATSR